MIMKKKTYVFFLFLFTMFISCNIINGDWKELRLFLGHLMRVPGQEAPEIPLYSRQEIRERLRKARIHLEGISKEEADRRVKMGFAIRTDDA